MVLTDIGQFLSRLFLGETTVRTFEDYFVATLEMLVICLVLVYLLTVVLLTLGLYRSERTSWYVDTDTRIKLCGAWAAQIVFILLSLTLLWVWHRGRLPWVSSFREYQIPLSPHWTVLTLLFLLWLAVFLNIRGELRRAQKTVPAD
jgi:hypothetical protein